MRRFTWCAVALGGTMMGSAAMAQSPNAPALALPATQAVQPLQGSLAAGQSGVQPAATEQSAGGFSAGGAAVGGSGPSPSSIDADYKIGANDLLEVEVFGVSELKRTVRVNSNGQISMPLIGMLQVAGLTPSDAEALIALQYGKDYLRDPQVSIFIKEFTTQRITVDGAVNKPGIYPLTGQITLLRALAMAGGGSQLSDLEQVMLFRMDGEGHSTSQKHDVNKIRLGEAPDPLLRGDDVVVVNRHATRVTLRDSLFRDLIDTLNPFSASYRNAVAN